MRTSEQYFRAFWSDKRSIKEDFCIATRTACRETIEECAKRIRSDSPELADRLLQMLKEVK